MNFFHAVVLGIVEGITEFLPISSTVHMILAGRLLGLQQTDFLKSFEIAIQLGAILSVLVLYGRLLWGNPKILTRVFGAFLPTAFLGFFCYKLIKQYLLASHQIVLFSLFFGGILMILFEKFHREGENAADQIENISWGKIFLIGVFQSIAMVPGVSRSAATILGGLLLGFKRKTIVEFSFFLAIPTMAAAAGLDLLRSSTTFSLGEVELLAVGLVVAFGTALWSIRFLIHFIQRHNFVPFGIYRVVAALIFWWSFH